MQGGHHKPLAGIEKDIRIHTPHGSAADPNIQKVYEYLDKFCDIVKITTIHKDVHPGALDIYSHDGLLWSIHIDGNNDSSLDRLREKLKRILEFSRGSIIPEHTPEKASHQVHVHPHVAGNPLQGLHHVTEHYGLKKDDGKHAGEHRQNAPPHHHSTNPQQDNYHLPMGGHGLHQHHSKADERPFEGIEGRLLFKVNRMTHLPPKITKIENYLSTLLNFGEVSESGEETKDNTFDVICCGELIWSLKRDGDGPEGLEKLRRALEKIKHDYDIGR